MVRRIAFLVSLVTLVADGHSSTLTKLYARGHLELAHEWTIGGEEDDLTLVQPKQFAVDGEGNVFVLDGKPCSVKQFGADGTWLADISGEGEGPGELLHPMAMALAPNGDVVTFDWNGRRIQVVDSGGEFIRSAHYEGMVNRIAVAQDGHVFALVRWTNPIDFKGPATFQVVRFAADLSTPQIVDSLRVQDMIHIDMGGGVSTVTFPPFGTRLSMCLRPDGTLLVGRSNQYAIDVYDPGLQKVGSIGRDIDPPRVGDDDRKAFFDRFEDAKAREAMRSAVDFPKQKTFFHDITADDEGNTLVRWIDDDGESHLYDTFDRNSNFIARVRVTGLNGTALIRGGAVYTLESNWFEHMPSLKKYRIVGWSSAD